MSSGMPFQSYEQLGRRRKVGTMQERQKEKLRVMLVQSGDSGKSSGGGKDRYVDRNIIFP